MNERDAIAVLLIRAVEASDPEGKHLSLATRRAISLDVARSIGATGHIVAAQADQFLAERARAMLPTLRPDPAQFIRATQPLRLRWIVLVVLLGAFAIGALSNMLGDLRRLNLLYAPIALLLLWNIATYVVLVVRWLLRLGAGRARSQAPPWLTRWTQSIHLHRTLEPARRAMSEWLTQGAPLHRARASFVWHIGAAALALGAIAGMYLRGLGIDYTAGWESTFLNERGVHTVLKFLLGPGALLLGTSVPDAQHIGTIRFTSEWISGRSGGERAADWIHLYAASTLMIILLPRLVMALFDRLRALRLVDRFPIDLDHDYFRRLLASSSATPQRLNIIPHGVAVDDALRRRIVLGLEQALGTSIEPHFTPAVPYGEQPSGAAVAANGVLVFSLASTPEQEVHGAILQGARPLAVVLDELSFTQRVRGDSTMKRRLQERRELWRQFLKPHQLDPVFVPLETSTNAP